MKDTQNIGSHQNDRFIGIKIFCLDFLFGMDGFGSTQNLDVIRSFVSFQKYQISLKAFDQRYRTDP